MRNHLRRALALIALCLSCCLLSSCIDGQEEITVQEDGSGSMQVSYNIPLRALTKEDAQQLETFLRETAQEHEVLKLTHFSTTPSSIGMHRLEIRLEFTSIQELAKLYEEKICSPSSEKPDPEVQALLDKVCALVGKFDISFDGLSIRVNRTIDLSPLFKGKVKNPKVLGESEFRYILHLPRETSSSNATHISEDKQTLQWTVKLQEHFDKPVVMQSTIPLPWWIPVSLIALGLTTLLGIIWLMRVLLRRKKLKENLPCPTPEQ